LLTTLLTATALLAATLFFALTLLAFTFLFLAILLLAALSGIRFAWFVWILLSFHITFRCYIANLSLILSRFAIRPNLFEIA
jgi:hypothetical protein